ncbi:Stk1 family PASTA domain-containing Ser/Thr kinase [Atopobium sp. oral taxon 199]|uniref:Stk1 family PASTA domain-containing Ser/Thr kinase n=1 Tax=Atopobium sp. oral taxon 199 TaxID=712156 RepID=UPI00034EAD22|nr:Stk1 family PASTA domain-containing Ser/Thr kinase [Atopobium sp. oral taxon 199]EPD78702.1 serine/threonine protein kinase, bacterial [Atopobium sp. oral taxon 199 str. F0494]
MPGRMLGGRYQVQDKIGTGGMATVYRGQDEVLGRTVAIKMMLPQYANDPSFAARFKQEAQAAAALSSPYIVSVYDWGKEGDSYYIVMEYLRGTDLKSGIRKHGALDSRKVAQIGSQIAQALSVAHKHDIIHRDIKPQNIMVQPDGNIKVMDFGIARAKNSHLTTDNSVLGTAHYVSPEQTQGKELGPTTDIYSLGIVMYEASTGRVPFEGDDAISVALKQVNEAPQAPTLLNPSMDPILESIILKCMEKDPANRYQTADELYCALRDYLMGRGSRVSTTTLMGAVPTSKMERRGFGGTQSMPVAVVSGRTGSTDRMHPVKATEQAQMEEDERKRKRRRTTILSIIVALLVFAAAVYGITTALSNQTQQYAVPNLVGMTKDEAINTLTDKDSHFKLGNVKEDFNDDAPEGQVIEQTPDADKMANEGSKVDIVVSKGAKPAATVKVPDLKKMTPDEAQRALGQVGLKGKQGDDVNDDSVPVGYIAQQDQAADSEAKAGDTITYHLSKGPSDISVPNVVGMTESQATKTLEAAGFKVRSQDKSKGDSSAKVSEQDPPAGTEGQKGDTVTIVIGQDAVKEAVPNVVGKEYHDAQQILQDAGFSPNTMWVYDDTVASGKVVSQSPQSVEKGGTVTIKVSSGRDPGTPSSPSGT